MKALCFISLVVFITASGLLNLALADEEITIVPQGAWGFITISGKAAEELYNEVLSYVFEDDQDGVFYKNAENIQCYKIIDDPEPPVYGCNVGFTNDGKALRLEDFLN